MRGLLLASIVIATVPATLAADAEDETVARALVAPRAINPYERRVMRTSMHGAVLFLVPYPDRLELFPIEICDLEGLSQLRIPDHAIETVPDDIARLTSLEVLDLGGNRIRALPDSIGDLTSLRELDLADNLLTTLPDSIGRLRSLEVLALDGNPLAKGELARLATLLPDTRIRD